MDDPKNPAGTARAVLTEDPALHETKGWLKAELERTLARIALADQERTLAKTLAKMDLCRSRAAKAAARLVQYRDPEKPAPRTEEELMDLVDYLVSHRPRDPVSGRPCPLMFYERRAIEVWHRFRRATLAAEKKLAEAAEEKSYEVLEEKLYDPGSPGDLDRGGTGVIVPGAGSASSE